MEKSKSYLLEIPQDAFFPVATELSVYGFFEVKMIVCGLHTKRMNLTLVWTD
jgi:hypothetical protein